VRYGTRRNASSKRKRGGKGKRTVSNKTLSFKVSGFKTEVASRLQRLKKGTISLALPCKGDLPPLLDGKRGAMEIVPSSLLRSVPGNFKVLVAILR
jgi:hypothetical protein